MRTLTNLGVVLAVMVTVVGCRNPAPAQLNELQRVHSGTLDVVLLSEGEALRQGKGAFFLEFKDPRGQLVDVGTVTVTATMTMPGMAPMFGDNTVKEAATKGRYEVASDLEMAGTWRLTVEWNGPAGRGSASLPVTVL